MLPDGAHERTVAEKKRRRGREEEEFVMTMQGTWKEARQLGEATARVSDVLTVLRVRGIAVPDAARERILAQKDPERLERWIEKAAVAASLEDVLDEPS